jgi:hypothetical protein
MNEGWPSCRTTTTLLGFTLVCGLPQGHELDGQQMHEDLAQGTCWSITVTLVDGTVRRV